MKKSGIIKTLLLVTVAALTLSACSSGGGTGSSIWSIIAYPLGYIMKYCYIFANDILHVKLSYVLAMFLFALITKALLFPLSLKQQKNTAKMAAYQPMVNEINKTYAKDKNRQQAELQKLQEEYGYNPMAGCLPTLIQFPILFGLIEVIYRPLSYMLTIPKALVEKLVEITVTLDNAAGGTLTAANRLVETNVIGQIQTNIGAFSELTSNPEYAGYIEKIANLNMKIGSVNLFDIPSFKDAAGNFALSWILLLPLFSIVTMLLSTFITMKTSGTGNAAGGSGKTMLITTSVMFGIFSFTFPAGFSLYWGLQNLIIIVQSYILRKIVDPDKIKAEAMAQIEEKKKAKKTQKKVKIKDDSGEVVEKELSASELDKMRLQKAREIDEERYNKYDE